MERRRAWTAPQEREAGRELQSARFVRLASTVARKPIVVLRAVRVLSAGLAPRLVQLLVLRGNTQVSVLHHV